MPVCRFSRLTVLALIVGGSATACAEGADDLHLSASLGQVHDSNLFRLPSDIDTLARIGRSSAAETINLTSLGLNYQRSYSLQEVELNVRVTDYRYQNFDYLSYMATNYRAAWNWSYTPHFYGLLRTARTQSLNSYDDYQGLNQKNLRTNKVTNFDATYELDARWRLKGALFKSDLSNSLPLTGEADYNSSALQAGVRYVLPSGTSAGYRIRATDGRYTTRRSIPSAGFYDTDFTQTDNVLDATWVISPKTQAAFSFGLRSRTHPNYPQRDFNNLIGSASVNWAYSGKTGLTAGWTREADAYETADFNFTQTDRFSVGPVWQISPKTTVRMQWEHAIRNFKGTPAGFVSAQRSDTTNNASVSVDWEPYRFLLLSASLQNLRRSSTAPGLGFSANVLSLSAQFTY